MESGFDKDYSYSDRNSEQRLSIASDRRFDFYKVRLFGVSQFVKRPSESFEDDFVTLESLRKEYIIGIQLNHPAIVRYINYDGRALYEEFIEGDNLKDLIDKRDGRLFNRDFVRGIAIQIFEALDYMHEMGIVHLDLKPENIMITRFGERVKIVDFGCAYSSSCDSTPGGTENYKAPERKTGVLEMSSDIYQAGRIIEEISSLCCISRRWRYFISKSVAENPNDRFKTAKDALSSIPHKINYSKNFLPIFLVIIGISIGGIIAIGLKEKPTEPLIVEKSIEIPEELIDSLVNRKMALREKNEEKAIVITKPAGEKTSHEEIIKRKITSFISSYYTKNVVPLYKDPESFGFVKNSEEQRIATQKAKQEAQQEAFKFGNELIRKYPSQKEMIETLVANTINEQQTRLGAIILSYQ